MNTDLVAFFDESKKPVRDRRTGKVAKNGEFYVVAGAVLMRGDVDALGSALIRLRASVGHPLHYRELSLPNRIKAIEGIDAIPDWDGYLFETDRALERSHNERQIRFKTLEAGFKTLANDVDVRKIMLETRNDPKRGYTTHDTRDHQLLNKLKQKGSLPADLRITHGSKTEPNLWLADLLAGARSDYLCGINDEVFWRITHRIVKRVSVMKKSP